MKKLRNLFVVFTMAFVLLGCYKVNLNIDVDEKGNAELAMDFLIQESMLSYTGQDIDSLKDAAKQGVEKDMQGEVKFKDLEKTIDKEKYVGFSMTYPKMKAEKGNKIIEVKDDEIIFTMDQAYLNELGASGLTGGSDEVDLEEAGVEFKLTVNMPGKVKEASVGKIDGNTVVVDLLKTQKTIKIVSEKGNGGDILLYVGIGVGVLIVAAAAFIFFKKKKDNNGDDEVTIITSPNEANTAQNAESTTEAQTSENEAVEAEAEVAEAEAEVVEVEAEVVETVVEEANDENK